jgi:hypothetical protein
LLVLTDKYFSEGIVSSVKFQTLVFHFKIFYGKKKFERSSEGKPSWEIEIPKDEN